jgi:hypothetical protein
VRDAREVKETGMKIGRVSHMKKIVLIFFAGGTVAGVFFAALISQPGLNHIWFTKTDWWLLPTPSYWFLVAGLFFIGFTVSYLIAVFQGWLLFPNPWYRGVLAICCATVIPGILIFFATSGTSLISVVLTPIVVGLFLSAALFVLSRKWYKLPTALMVTVYLVAPIIADIPNLFVSGGYMWFDAITFVIRSSLLLALCGWWLAKANSHLQEPQPHTAADGEESEIRRCMCE